MESPTKCCCCLPIKCGLVTAAVFQILSLFFIWMINFLLWSDYTSHVFVSNICFIPIYYSSFLYIKWIIKDNVVTREYLAYAAKMNIFSWSLIHFSTIFEIFFMGLFESLNPIGKMIIPLLTIFTFFICMLWYYLMVVSFRYIDISHNLSIGR